MSEATFKIQLLGPDDAAVLDRVDPDVFDEAIDPKWTAEFFRDPRHHIAVALVADLVVGMATAIHYVHPDKAPSLFVMEAGVAGPYRRRGIGKALMATLLEHGRELGCREVWVATEHDNTAALALYASSGGVRDEGASVVFTYSL